MPQSHYTNGNTGKLHYLSYSDKTNPKPVLLFLHGMTCHAHYWDEIAPAFTDKYAVYALDFRGHGDSDFAPAGNDEVLYHFKGYLEDVASFLAVIGQEVTVVGHSLGGYVALKYEAENPHSFNKIIACDVKTNSTLQEHEGGKRAAAKPQPAFASIEEIAVRLKATMPDSSVNPETLLNIAQHGSKQNEDGSFSLKYDRRLLDFEPINPFKFAPNVNTICLIIQGERSIVMNTEQAQQLTQALPKAQSVEIKNAGHHVFLDNPAEFKRVLKEFLEVFIED